MKAFNLEEALAGKPVITRDGKKVVEIIHLSSMRNERNVLAVFENDCMLYKHNGTCMLNLGDCHRSDLIMAPEKKSIWVNVYEVNSDFIDEFPLSIGRIHLTKEAALSNKNSHYIKTIEITNESDI